MNEQQSGSFGSRRAILSDFREVKQPHISHDSRLKKKILSRQQERGNKSKSPHVQTCGIKTEQCDVEAIW